MARQSSDDYCDVDEGIHAWLAAWWQERARYLSRLDVRFVEPLREDQEISVVVFPHVHHRDALGRNQEPQYYRGYELLSICCVRHARQTRPIGYSHPRDDHKRAGSGQSASGSFSHAIVLDRRGSGRATYEGKSSILLGPTWGQLTDRAIPFQDWMVQPVWQLERVLDFWAQFGERFVIRDLKKPDGSLGKADYLTIPPRWVALYDLDQRADDEVDGSKIPVLVSPHLKPFVESLQDAYGELYRITGPVNITLSIPRGDSVPQRTT